MSGNHRSKHSVGPREAKGDKREAKGGQGRPKGGQREAKGRQREAKGGKREAKGAPIRAGSTFDIFQKCACSKMGLAFGYVLG